MEVPPSSEMLAGSTESETRVSTSAGSTPVTILLFPPSEI